MQRGTILMRTGRWQEALAQLTAAEPLLEADPYQLAGVLMNRGVLYLSTGNVRRARGDFVKGQTVAGEANLELQVAKATHNLGYCELLGGDVPSALNLFGAAASVYRRIAPGLMPALETDRARALLAVGLADEAASELDSAIAAFRRRRSTRIAPRPSWTGRRPRWPPATPRPPGAGRPRRSGGSAPAATTPGRHWPSSPGCARRRQAGPWPGSRPGSPQRPSS